MAHQWPNMALPVLGLPGHAIAATRTTGAPIGVQLIGRAYDKESLFTSGEAIESASGITTPIDPAS